MCSEEGNRLTLSVFVLGVCGGLSGCTTGTSGHRKSFGMCVVHWRLGSERVCMCVYACAGGVCPREGFVSIRERLAVSRPLCLCVFLSLGVYASGACMCCICR